jgi:hypothetical protein
MKEGRLVRPFCILALANERATSHLLLNSISGAVSKCGKPRHPRTVGTFVFYEVLTSLGDDDRQGRDLAKAFKADAPEMPVSIPG